LRDQPLSRRGSRPERGLPRSEAGRTFRGFRRACDG
jgi:hypothetical protein